MNIFLSDIEARVLGCLVEKESTTPEYYPLSLNALVHACNQKSNREPLMNLEEDAVRQALHTLSEQALTRSASGDSRVAKYEHRLADTFNFTRPETAILCELLLRGPQTPGELRSRAERMHPFEDLSVVQSTLKHLTERNPPLVKLLPRQPGNKEARYAHLLSGDMEGGEAPPLKAMSVSSGSAENARMTELEAEISSLRKEVADLKGQFAEFRKQFE
ncbi:MAG TPA: YceH family protein [Candidatus Acidoferrum sp.]